MPLSPCRRCCCLHSAAIGSVRPLQHRLATLPDQQTVAQEEWTSIEKTHYTIELWVFTHKFTEPLGSSVRKGSTHSEQHRAQARTRGEREPYLPWRGIILMRESYGEEKSKCLDSEKRLNNPTQVPVLPESWPRPWRGEPS